LLTPPGAVRQKRRPDPRSLLDQAAAYTPAQDKDADLEARVVGSWSAAIDSAWTRRFLELEAEVTSWRDEDAIDDVELLDRNEMRGLFTRERERLLARLASGDLRLD